MKFFGRIRIRNNAWSVLFSKLMESRWLRLSAQNVVVVSLKSFRNGCKKVRIRKVRLQPKKRLAPGGSSSATLIDIDLLTVLWPVGTGKVNISTAMTEKRHFYVPLLVSKAEPPQFGDFDCRYSSTIFKFFFIENIFEMLCSKTFELPFKKLILWIDTVMLFIAVPL